MPERKIVLKIVGMLIPFLTMNKYQKLIPLMVFFFNVITIKLEVHYYLINLLILLN